MTDRDDVLRELGEALNVEPSSEFAEGVRARVSRSRVRSRHMWWGLAAAASVTLAATLVWRQPADVPVSSASSQPTGVRREAVVPHLRTSAPADSRTPELQDPRTPGLQDLRTPGPRQASAPLRTSGPRDLGTSGPQNVRLVVITNQGAILRELWAEYGAQALVETAVERAEPVALAAVPGEIEPPPPIEVAPIVVAPIVVSELGSAGERGGAGPVIRRYDATRETR